MTYRLFYKKEGTCELLQTKYVKKYFGVLSADLQIETKDKIKYLYLEGQFS